MARLNFTAAIFFCLLALSRANPPEKDGVDVVDQSEPTSTTATILLPSEKPGYEAATLVQFDHDMTSAHEGHDSKPQAHHESDEERSALPLASVSFHTINRHGPPRGRGRLHLRRGHRCRHHWAPRVRAHHGVILSHDRWGSVDTHRVAHRVPGRWVRVHHGKPRFGHVDLNWRSKHMKKAHLHRHAGHGEDSEYHHQHHHDKAKSETEDPGLFMKIRKFLRANFD